MRCIVTQARLWGPSRPLTPLRKSQRKRRVVQSEQIQQNANSVQASQVSTISQGQQFILEQKFEEISTPLPTDILELVGTTGLERKRIQRWFRRRRASVQKESIGAGARVVEDAPRQQGDDEDEVIEIDIP